MSEKAPKHFNLGGDEPPFRIALNGFKLWAYQTEQPSAIILYIPFFPGTSHHHVNPADLAQLAAHISGQPPELTPFSYQVIPTPPWVTSGAQKQLVLTVPHATSTPELNIG